MPIQVEVWGDYACFTRPEMKTERVSYDVMTPSAARGLLESIYWHPGLRWVIDRIDVCSPIRFTNIRRNEVKDIISANKVKAVMNGGVGELYLATPESIQQRAAMVLQDVHYVIDAHFEIPRYTGISRPFPPLCRSAALSRRAEGRKGFGVDTLGYGLS